MKKYFIMIFLSLGSCILLRAQQTTDLFITSGAAGTDQVGDLEITWTLGEIAVSEQPLDSTLITEGFHQGNLPFRVEQQEDDGHSVSTILTPGNQDGLNDVLMFPELDSLPAMEKNDIVIFNRWGQVVYKAKPYRNDWRGTDQGGQDLPEGTYYFVLLLRDGMKDFIHGNILIIR